MKRERMLPHLKHLLKTGDMSVYPIVFEASFGEDGHPFASSLYLIYCQEAYKHQSLTFPFNFDMFHSSWKMTRGKLKPPHEALLKYKCIEYVKGEDNRKKYIKIIV